MTVLDHPHRRIRRSRQLAWIVPGLLLAWLALASTAAQAAVGNIELVQAKDNMVEAVLTSPRAAPRFVSHIVTDTTTCDDSIYHSHFVRQAKHDPYYIIDGIDGWDKRDHYQGSDSDNWATIWETDKNHQFRFRFPVITSWLKLYEFSNIPGQYLCMRVGYHGIEDNADYKRIDLLTLTEPRRDDKGDHHFSAKIAMLPGLAIVARAQIIALTASAAAAVDLRPLLSK